MKRSDRLDAAIAAVRDSRLDPETEREVAERVRPQLGQALEATRPAAVRPIRLQHCEDFRSLLESFARGELRPGRLALVEDHVRSCVSCRRALGELRSGRPAAANSATVEEAPTTHGRWLAAAAGLVLVSLLGWAGMSGLLSGPEPRLAQVRAIDGTLLNVGFAHAALSPGEWIAEGQTVRTTDGSSAQIQLADGSKIEIGERSQLSVRERRGSVVVRVDRGDVIVEAAKQRNGELSVATDDLLASVKGTVFAVGAGAKGSRVAVLEGEVQVTAGRQERLLAPGEQFLSNARLRTLPFESAISWSQDAERYLEQLREVRALRQELAAVSLAPDLRYSKRLLDLAPAGTVLYASLPNLGTSLEEARGIVERRLEASPALAEWWTENVERSGLEGMMERASALLNLVAEQLGEEIVFAMVPSAGSSGVAVAMTELRDPDGFEGALRAALAELDSEAAGNFDLRFVVDPSEETSSPDEILLWIADDLLVVSTDPAGLQAVSRTIGSGSRFVESRLYRELASRYDEGTEMVAGVDLKTALSLAPAQPSGEEAAIFEWSGIGDADTLVIDSKMIDGTSQIAADLSFGAARRGVAAWLAAPAPMGSLEFVSADSTAATAFLFKDPAELVDELLRLLEILGPEAMQGLAEMESHLGLDLREDLAAPLGGEVAAAIDGPLLPQPAWKVIVEVVDEVRLQSTIETMVAHLDETLRAEAPGASLALAEHEFGGRVYHEISWAGGNDTGTVVYSFVEGYLVAASSRELVDRAIETRASQYNLLDAPDVTRLMPVDRHIHFSGLLYQDVGSVLAPLAGAVSQADDRLSPEEQQMVAEMSAELLSPTLMGFYGEEDSVRLVGTTQGGLLGGVFDRLLGAGQLLEMGRRLESPEEDPPR